MIYFLNRTEFLELQKIFSKELSSIHLIKVYNIRYGTNVKRIPKIKSLFELIIEALSDKILIILLIAATVSMTLGIISDGWPEGAIDGASIYIAVIAITSITSGNNYVKEK